MDAILVEGGNPLRGEVPVSGAKNAALPILAATLLVDGEVRLEGLPELRDIKTMLRLLAELRSAVEHNADGSLSLAVEDATRVEAPYKI
ncbi:MAG: UDP-N-acetylglucosamine 1-carboxyvinyltransferase, partial [Planctomycetota bacterium]